VPQGRRFEEEETMESVLQDLRYSVRTMMKRPGFTAVALVTLAFGIGANSAIFSVVNAVLLRPLPYDNPDQLVRFWAKRQPGGDLRISVSLPDLLDYKSQGQSFESIAAFATGSGNLTGREEPERITTAITTAAFFPILRVEPILGRTFLPEEDGPGAAPVAVLSYGLWQRLYGGDPNVIGQTIEVSGNGLTIVGVAPAGFQYPRGVEAWAPLGLYASEFEAREERSLNAVARLKPGVTPERAQTEIDAIAAGLEQAYPATNTNWGAMVVPLHDVAVGDTRPTLLALLAAVGFVLLIACANVANLLLARAATRQKETAVRVALGASRLRLVQQALAESLLLALIGGALGLLLALWSVDLLVALGGDVIPRAKEIGVDWRVAGFTLGISLLTGLVFSLVPAPHVASFDVNEALKEGGRGSGGGSGSQRFRGALVISEVTLAFVLLIGAGLMVKSFVRLWEVDPGFDPDGVLTMEVALPQSAYNKKDGTAAGFYRRLLERVGALPGVAAAGAVGSPPLGDTVYMRSISTGSQRPAPGEEDYASYHIVGADYLQAMGVPLLKGRYFSPADVAGTPSVMIVSNALARRLWPGEDPVGRRVTMWEQEPITFEVVGVAGDVRNRGLEDDAEPQMYVPHGQDPWTGMTLAMRTTSDPAGLVAAVRREVLALDDDLPVYNIKTMEQVLADSATQRRFSMLLFAVFAGVALLLAAVGIYGVMAYTVAQRTHEIGVRMALGAQRGDVMKLVLGQGMTLVAIGVLLGLVAALALGRVLSGLLFGVAPSDPAVFGVNALIFAAVALVACYVPARRATRVDPIVALRYE
jgi:putative ABC transport system permease protein